MESRKAVAVDDEPGRADIGLDDIFRFGASILETGGGMFENCGVEDFVKIGGFNFLVASFVDF